MHGPGCPVCVTSVELIDRAVAIASRPDVIFTSFGDMLRVPGSSRDLLSVKASGGDVRIVYSPLDAVALAAKNPGPPRGLLRRRVRDHRTRQRHGRSAGTARWASPTSSCSRHTSSSLLRSRPSSSSPTNRVQGFLAAGHVCTVMGYEEYLPLAARFHTPIVVTGFEPVDILHGILMTVRQLEEGRAEVENQYSRVVRREGNPGARAVIADVFETSDRTWRGIGIDPARAATGSVPHTLRWMQNNSSMSATSRHANRPCASREASCRGSANRTNARRSAASVHPNIRSAHRWSPPKVPVPLTTATER